MKIKDILSTGHPTLSFEVFPPKTEDKYESVSTAVSGIAGLNPDFMSVTYGAGGGTSRYTVDIAKSIKALGITPLAHLTCVSTDRQKAEEILTRLKSEQIENVLALRGDIPPEGRTCHDFEYASDLVREIKTHGDFCVGAACYPEGHVESTNKAEDIAHLKEKVDAGCDFITTQMFFDNNLLFNFLYHIREKGIMIPVIAGIMPVTNGKQMKRILTMSGTSLPERFKTLLDRFGDDPKAMKQAGIAYATDQIIDLLANDVGHIHVYSMNKPDVAKSIRDNLSDILK